MEARTSRTGTTPIKSCACGRRFTKAEWNRLPLVGRTSDDVESRVLKNGPDCKSTISIGRARVVVLYTVERAPGGLLAFRRAVSGEEVMLRDGGDLGALHTTERAARATIRRERRADREAGKRLNVDVVIKGAR